MQIYDKIPNHFKQLQSAEFSKTCWKQLLKAKKLVSSDTVNYCCSRRIEVRRALSTSQLVHNLFISLIIKGNNFCIWIYGYQNCLVPYICMYLQKSYFRGNCAVCVISTGGSYKIPYWLVSQPWTQGPRVLFPVEAPGFGPLYP